MEFKELERLVIDWANDRGILSNGTTMGQAEKTHEEVLELISAIDEDDRDEVIDAIGDITVTLIIQAKMQGLEFEQCLESAYNVITKRKGKMSGGKFIKE
ncbi:MazG-like family protein [Flavobacterium sp.]|uniref:MazG-like family protein n=1 Tax=Flavobacterium sp. TaxID=239 RepID=UPI0025E7F72B|nr:MazG-like family protein [Flavobacterium sp.]